MSKQTITFDDLVMCLSMMNNDNTFGIVLNKLDQSLTEEELYYYHQRLLFYKRTSTEKINMAQAAVIMLKEEKVDRIVVALAMFGYCNYYYGGRQSDKRRAAKDDIISQALDKLAEQLEGKVDVIKVNFEGNENKPNRPSVGERDRPTDTGEGKGD